jgi:hypothetical protein
MFTSETKPKQTTIVSRHHITTTPPSSLFANLIPFPPP